ncbi:unnamed protein product [Sordaria macrospora k-hell]|uniref:WGS project CABT00000000 data, contig 2.65 n=1 Tax=Sordaria macrospora (strain ATCC MYA-333 / DSM 997 / K(L3346) / K-hell) TaxID=771870 RepID=F7WAU5_SORMK|nr:uncharacterized protein SMAC_08772 [Sordaria macrospora k-hell]CCC14260.1 unnamed protein product [Sordaria macrospora k-hell]
MSTILVPLYIYPSQSGLGWSPLFSALTSALERNPSLEFLVVINPGNGPGPDYPIPNADYRAALSRLSSYNNVKVIGYVHCGYGERELGEIEKDVGDYLAWLDFADDERGEWWALMIAGAWIPMFVVPRLVPRGRGSDVPHFEPGTAMISGTEDVPGSWIFQSPDLLLEILRTPLCPGSPHGDPGGRISKSPSVGAPVPCLRRANDRAQPGARGLKDPALAIDTRHCAVHGPTFVCFVTLPLCVSAIRLDGIFVDEVPTDAKYLDYLQSITDTFFVSTIIIVSIINNTRNRDHNPGIFPAADSSDAFFSSRLVDYVVVFENCLAAWWDSGDYVSANLALLTPEKRAKAIAVAHTCGCGPKSQAGDSGGRPQQQDSEGHHTDGERAENREEDAIKKNVQHFLNEVVTQHKLAGHFATSATDYATWCSGWEAYVEVACDLAAATC